MNWLDLIIMLTVAWYGWTGIKTGLVGGLARILGLFLGLAAAFQFHRPLADAANLKWNLVPALGKWLPVPAVGPGGLAGADGRFALPKGVLDGLGGPGVPLNQALASGILDLLSFIIIFLIVSKGAVIFGSILGNAVKMFLLGPVDRLGGFILGAAKGLVMSAVLVALMKILQLPAAVFSGGGNTDWISLALDKSVVAPYFVKALVILDVKLPGWNA